jgi:hypothetical protein
MKPRINLINIQNVIIIGVSFLLGATLYFVSAIGIDKFTPHASAASSAWHQVTVQVGICNCITKFEPSPSLSGGGTDIDPFVDNNTTVDMLVGVNGQGHVTIEDETGATLAEFDKTASDPTDRLVTINFKTVGSHKLIVKIDGFENAANGLPTELFFLIGKLPPLVPDIKLPWMPNVPNTGYIYIGGYAVQVYSLIISGAVFAVIAGILLAAHRRRQDRDRTNVKVFVRRQTRRPVRSRPSPRKTPPRRR